MSETVTTLSVPKGHPAHILLDQEQHDFPHIEVEVFSGARPEGLPGVRRWGATATVADHAAPPLHIPVARMSLTLVNEFLCDPVYVLDAIDRDSLLIGEALWSGDERRLEFEDLLPDSWGAVAIVNSYEVVPEWRRTPLSPMLALRMLNVFAELDVSAAALYAAPYNSSLRGTERSAASAKILAMWQRAGFTRLYREASPAEEFSHVMVRTLNASEIDRHVAALAGTDQVLRTAVGD